MEELKVFGYEQREIRTIQNDGEIWWILKDICEVLEIKNTSDIVKRLDSDEVTRFNLGSKSGEVNAVNESGLYNVILRSDKPQAKPFRKWVTSEVLPSIRKNGGYIANQEQMTPEQIVASALVVAQNIIDKQNKKLQEQEPLVKFAEHVSESTNSISIGDFAKIVADENIRVGRNRMFDWLKHNRYIMKGRVIVGKT